MPEILRRLKVSFVCRGMENLTLIELSRRLERRLVRQMMAQVRSSPWGYLAQCIQVLTRAGRLDELDRVLRIVMGIRSKYERSKTLSYYARILTGIGKEKMARDVADWALLALDRYHDKGGRPHALAHAASAFADLGDIDRSLAILEEIRYAYYPDSDALSEVAAALTRAGRLKEALALAERTRYPACRENALAHIAMALADAGEFEEAQKIAQSSYKDYAVEHIASTLAAAARIQDAIAVAGEISGGAARAEAYSRLARSVTDADTALCAWDCISDRAHVPTEGLQGLVTGIIRTLCRAGRIKDAIEIAERSNLYGEEHARALSCIARALALTGKKEEAIAMLDVAMEKAKPEPADRLCLVAPWQMPAHIVGAFADVGEIDRALALVQRALEMVRQTGDLDSVLRVAEVLIAKGERERGKKLFVDAIRAAEGMERDYYRLEALFAIHTVLSSCLATSTSAP
jgi:tetratricopeptide (TPR) repeat protein